jgi:hypothetical protein
MSFVVGSLVIPAILSFKIEATQRTTGDEHHGDGENFVGQIRTCWPVPSELTLEF